MSSTGIVYFVGNSGYAYLACTQEVLRGGVVLQDIESVDLSCDRLPRIFHASRDVGKVESLQWQMHTTLVAGIRLTTRDDVPAQSMIAIPYWGATRMQCALCGKWTDLGQRPCDCIMKSPAILLSGAYIRSLHLAPKMPSDEEMREAFLDAHCVSLRLPIE